MTRAVAVNQGNKVTQRTAMAVNGTVATGRAAKPDGERASRHHFYASIFGIAYTALMSNLLLALGCAPIVIVIFMTDPAESWPLLALATPLCLPAIVAIFAVMSELRDLPGADGRSPESVVISHHGSVVRTFGHAWRASFKGAASLGALAVAALLVLGVDMAWAWGQRIGAVAIPVLAVLMVLVVATALLGLVVLAERPAVRLRDLLKASLYLAVRRWYLTLLSLVVLALLVQVVATRPAIGMGLVAAPLLYVVWANSRFTLRPALDQPPSRPASTRGDRRLAQEARST